MPSSSPAPPPLAQAANNQLFGQADAAEQFSLLPGFHDFAALADQIKTHGYAVVENAIDRSVIDAILADSQIAVPRINANALGPVFLSQLRYTTNAIALSRSVYNIITSAFVLNFCKTYFTGRFQLVNNRIQTTIQTVDMPWHTDNNRLSDGKLVGRHNLPGLQFIVYLTDIQQSPFQLIRGSQYWSSEFKGHYLTSADADQHAQDQICLTPALGSLLIINTHIFHRAAPVSRHGYQRAILLFQVDEMSDQLPGHGEKLLLNPEYLDNFNAELATFFGFGCRRNYPAFPETSAATIGVKENLAAEWQLMRQLFRAIFKQVAKLLLPHNWIVTIKNRSLEPKRPIR